MKQREQRYFDQLKTGAQKKAQEIHNALDQRSKELQKQRPNYYENLLKRGDERRKQNEENFSRFVREIASKNKSTATAKYPLEQSTYEDEQYSTADLPTSQVHQSSAIFDLDDPPAYSFESEEEDDIIPIEEFDFNESQRRPTKMDLTEKVMCVLLHQARFNTSNREVEKIVNLFNSMGGAEKIPWTDWDTLINKVPNKFLPTMHKYFYTSCETCEGLFGPISDTSVNNVTCVHGQGTSGFFIYIKVSDWLRHIITLRYDEIIKNVTQRANRFIHDLPDTLHYRNLTKPSADGIPIVTLTIGWDGVAFTNDSSRSMWPLVAYLNELNFQDRITNPMLLAIDSNANSPKDDLMFRPLIDELISLEKNPIKVYINDVEKLFYVKLLLIIADAPARAKILNFNNHNGIYGKINLIYLPLYNSN